MIISTPQPDDLWQHVCSKCRSARINKFERYRWSCACVRPDPVGRRAATPAAPVVRPNRTPRPPCVFLGESTGKRHKVGCGDKYLDEHFCRCSQRQIVEIKSRKGTQSKVLTPKAIPRGRCRDLEIYKGAVAACVDCPLYRAGLLTSLPAE